MDGMRAPVGDRSPEVYWRRRVVALVVIAMAIAIAVLLIVSPKGDNPTDKPGTSPSPEATTGASPTAAATGQPGAACTADQVTITVTPHPFTFGGGALPVFDVALSNSGATACTLDTTSGSSLVVWSGGESNKETYFSSTYCDADATVPAQVFNLVPGQASQTQVTWSRQRVGEGCTTGTAPSDGFYWAQLTLNGIASEPSQFELASA